jgi:hypothetical protein
VPLGLYNTRSPEMLCFSCVAPWGSAVCVRLKWLSVVGVETVEYFFLRAYTKTGTLRDSRRSGLVCEG